MLNLYEVLEVSEKASIEVIEKAYRVLAKKYHPDLQIAEEKTKAENKMKQINEAYEILSNEAKRKQYDIQLMQERQRKRQEEIKKKQIEPRYSQEIRNQDISNEEEKMKKGQLKQRWRQEEYEHRQRLQEEMKRAYMQAYNQYWRSRRI